MRDSDALTSSVLCNSDEWLGSRVELRQLCIHVQELYIIVMANDSTTLACFYVLFVDITGLVIEKSMGVSAPGHAPHIDPKLDHNRAVS